jgi:hypothetical protein
MSKVQLKQMQLMPVAKGNCSQCNYQHPADQPHNAQTMYYQVAFYQEHGRWPTWVDAMSHCTTEVQAQWTIHLVDLGVDVQAGKLSPPDYGQQ